MEDWKTNLHNNSDLIIVFTPLFLTDLQMIMIILKIETVCVILANSITGKTHFILEFYLIYL